MFGREAFLRRAGLVAFAVLMTLTGARCGSASPTAPIIGPGVRLSSLPGTPGHFDNGEFSFDYPADWPVLAEGVSSPNRVEFIVAVLGTGTWSENCQSGTDSQGDWMTCGPDNFDVPPGGVVVKLSWQSGGPAPWCASPAPTANSSAGPNAVIESVNGDVTTWEFAQPGTQFFWPNNPIFEVHTADAAQLAKAEAMVASFRWEKTAGSWGPDCGAPAAT